MTPAPLDALLTAFADSNQVMRRRALRQLLPHLAVARVRDAVLAALEHDPAWRCRRAAAQALGKCDPDPVVIPALIRVLTDARADRQVREAASASLAAHAAHALIQDRLLPLLRHPQWEVRQLAASALAPAAAEPRVQQALLASAEHDPSEWGRRAAVQALAGQVAAPAVWPVLHRLLVGLDARPGAGDAHDMVRAIVAGVLRTALAGPTPAPDVVALFTPTLLIALEDPAGWVRQTTIAALAPQATQSPVREALLGLLAAPDHETRWWASHALLPYVTDAVIAAGFCAQLTDPTPATRRQTVQVFAYTPLREPMIRAALERVAQTDPDAEIRQAAAAALQRNP